MDLKEKIRHLPAETGVYLFKNSADKIIYVGSSVSLNKRISSYFQSGKDFKTRSLSEEIHDFDYIATDSLKEALILENNLIKKHKPKYNIKLKDDKKYPFIEISAGFYPYINITRDINNPKSFYFGPYTNVKSLRRILYILRKIFKIRTCKCDLPAKNIKGCIYNNIKICSAPCLSLISEENYTYNVRRAMDFLNGKISFLIKDLRKKIKSESKLLNYEACSYFQNILKEVTLLTEKQKVFFRKKINADYIGVSRAQSKFSLSFLQIREGKLIEEKNFIFKAPAEADISEVIIYSIKKLYANLKFQDLKFYVPVKIKDKNYLSEELGKDIKIYHAARGVNKEILDLANKNAELKLNSDNLYDIDYSDVLQKLKEIFGLRKIPYVIKAVDISNISGSFPTGSVVCFKNGIPDKKNYRHYIIRGQTKDHRLKTTDQKQNAKVVIDDYAMIGEVLRRNLKTKEGRPDLLIIDGGKGHLNTALKILREMNIYDVELLSIAKKEELIYTPHKKEAVNIHKYGKVLNMIRYIRDEAHRFAIKLHKKRRSKGMIVPRDSRPRSKMQDEI